ncbi:uncharacterized protein B0H18DRAFT_1053829 [Fomitopsis serialis]|uniref:uncharacterized protein n=1 Tax=Fomitopsis serialis TaxID=139415 RepID=UPI002008413C|nr:uncharacterized protein B0H18DRAFT_1053829 [Neoantrodia serialis]KAH9912463.1 hypothetical protein B0H18DRAFT_1053829 [Neoantrodia serialis]
MEAENSWPKRLPLEIWQIVLSQTSPATTRKCLAVSRLFHDLAARIVFSTLRIQFGCWEASYDLLDEPFEGDRGCRSCCVLLHTITDPVFASYVKHLHIYAFADKFTTSEMCGVTKAIGTLSNLRTLRWYTNHRSCILPSDELLEALAATAVCLREYQLPIQCLSALPALKRLPASSLCLYFPEQYSLEEELHWPCDVYRSSFASLLEARRGSLTQLTAPNQAVWECPPHILRGLTHLTIDDVGHSSNLDLISPHCTRLESLQIILHLDFTSELCVALAANPAAFPHLTYLKLLSDDFVDGTRVNAVASFIRPKTKLRCLDFNGQCSTVEELSPVLDAIRSLSDLEILGLDVGLGRFGQETIDLLRCTIPKGVTALRLGLDYDDLAAPGGYSWAELWAGLPKLTFAHIGDVETRSVTSIPDLADAIASLRLVGHCSRFHEVYRADDGVTLGEPWSATKVQFRTVEDFGSKDWEWLMRGHFLP